jgi:hypothetical protein
MTIMLDEYFLKYAEGTMLELFCTKMALKVSEGSWRSEMEAILDRALCRRKWLIMAAAIGRSMEEGKDQLRAEIGEEDEIGCPNKALSTIA